MIQNITLVSPVTKRSAKRPMCIYSDGFIRIIAGRIVLHVLTSEAEMKQLIKTRSLPTSFSSMCLHNACMLENWAYMFAWMPILNCQKFKALLAQNLPTNEVN